MLNLSHLSRFYYVMFKVGKRKSTYRFFFLSWPNMATLLNFVSKHRALVLNWADALLFALQKEQSMIIKCKCGHCLMKPLRGTQMAHLLHCNKCNTWWNYNGQTDELKKAIPYVRMSSSGKRVF